MAWDGSVKRWILLSLAVQPRAVAQRIAARELDVALLLLGAVGQMIAQLAAAAHQLHAAGTRPAQRVVVGERRWQGRAVGVAQAGSERDRVLHRLRRTLREERQHRMRG